MDRSKLALLHKGGLRSYSIKRNETSVLIIQFSLFCFLAPSPVRPWSIIGQHPKYVTPQQGPSIRKWCFQSDQIPQQSANLGLQPSIFHEECVTRPSSLRIDVHWFWTLMLNKIMIWLISVSKLQNLDQFFYFCKILRQPAKLFATLKWVAPHTMWPMSVTGTLCAPKYAQQSNVCQSCSNLDSSSATIFLVWGISVSIFLLSEKCSELAWKVFILLKTLGDY